MPETINCITCPATTNAKHPTSEGWRGLPHGKLICPDCRARIDRELSEPTDCPEQR